MSRGRHRRARLLIPLSLTVLAILLAGSVAGAYAYDRATQDRVLPGITIDGVDVGNMTRAQATSAMAGRVGQLLAQPIAIRAAGRLWSLTRGALGVQVDVASAVDQAFSLTDSRSWVWRVYERLTGRPTATSSISLPDRLSRPTVKAFVERVAAAVAKPAQDAAIDLGGDGMQVLTQRAHPGRTLDVAAATKVLLAGLRSAAPEVTLPTQPVAPAVMPGDLGKTITVDLSTNTLRLYDGLKVEKTYPVATARYGFSTPVGNWKVVAKLDAPAWYNPAPTGWGAGMPLYIPPGPGNPLGLRALGLNSPGIYIHGTPESWSIGTYASHGCIRMLESDAITLFSLVPMGTSVIIYGAPPWGTAGTSATPGF